jgi:ribose transport system substrate-binding protein
MFEPDVDALSTREDHADRREVTAEDRRGISRKSLLALGGAAGAGLMLPGADLARAAASPTQNKGPKQTVAISFIFGANPSVTAVLAGFRNVAELVGWKVHNYISYAQAESALTLEKVLEEGLTSKPDIFVTGMWFNNAAPAMKKAKDAGAYVMAVNVADPAVTAKLGYPFVGQDFVAAGETLGNTIAGELLKRGTKTGVILSGNAAPGALPIEQRIKGIKLGTQQFNKAHGTSFSNDVLNDDAATDLGKSVSQYQAKLTQLGKKFVAFAGTGTETGTANIKVAQTLRWKPGQYVVGTFDTGPSINDAIRDGITQFAMDQQFFYQGIVAGFQAWAALNRGGTPILDYNTGSSVVTKATIAAVAKRDTMVAKLQSAYGLKA